jgi:hypothetical protein
VEGILTSATDNLIEAEKLIRATFAKTDAQKRALETCRWLLGFNSIEMGFKIKCYPAPAKQICFCVDRGSDCEAKRVQTWFLRLVTSDLRLTLRPITIEPNTPYLKMKIKKLNRSSISYAIIQPPDSTTISLELLKKHIFDSYELKLNELGLVSKVPTTDNVLQSTLAQDGSHIPTKEDIESAYWALARPGETISIDAVLDLLETNAKKKGLLLNGDWRMVTEKCIAAWSVKKL